MMRYVQPALTPAKTSLQGIPKGYLGTRETLKHIQALIREGAKDFYVRQKAIDILLAGGVRPKDYREEIKVLFEWVQQNVRYTKDPFHVEVLHSARRMLELRAGDCDDMTILLAAMLEAIGHPTRLVIIGPDPFQPRLFSHIYLEVNHKGTWIPLDPTMPFPAGWAPKTYVKQVISIDRRNPKMFGDMELQGTDSVTMSADWLPGLAQNISGGALTQRDPRVRQLYDLLRQRQLWVRSPRMRRVLRFAWRNGLANRQRPRTGAWFMWRLRRWGLLPGPVGPRPPFPAAWGARRPFRRVGLRPYRRIGPPWRPGGLSPFRRVSLRPVQVRPVQPVRVSVAPRPFYGPRR